MTSLAPIARLAATSAFALVCVFARRAEATDPPDATQFSWVRGQGADECADAAAIMRDVSRRLGRDPFAASAERRIEGFVVREADRWLARLYVRDANGVLAGSRDIDSEAVSCDSLGAAVALAVALTIDPDAELHSRVPDPPAAPVQVVAPPVPVTAAPIVETLAPHEPSTPRWIHPHAGNVSARAVALSGAMSRSAFGGALALDASIVGPLRWEAGALYTTESRAFGSSSNSTFTLAAGWLAACVEGWPHARVGLTGCAGAMGGLVSQRVISTRRPGWSSDAAWGGPMLDARITVTLVGPFIAELGVQGVVPITPSVTAPAPRFAAGIASNPAPALAGLGYVGVGLQF